MSPEVSVCIPTYNYGRFLPQAIHSVLKQTFTDFELIIVDDCSKDDTKEVLKQFANKDKRILVSVNSTNLGMVKNWNKCLALAKGNYIKYVFADDLLYCKDALKKMVSILESDSTVSLVASSRYILDEESKIINKWSHFKSGVKYGKEVINKCLLEQCNYIGEPTVVMFRKSQAQRGFEERYRQIVDMEMWFYLLEQGKFAFIDEPLCGFRVHPEQQTEKNAKTFATFDDTFYLFNNYLNKPYIKKSYFQKEYLKYDHAYQVWKSYRKKKLLTKQQAYERITSSYSARKLLLYMPLYKIYREYLRCRKKYVSE